MKNSRPIATLSLVAASALVLAGCAAEAAPAAEETTPADEAPLEWSFEFNTAAEDEDPAYEPVTVEVPRNPEKVVIFDMASFDTWVNLGGEVAGAPLESVPDYLEDGLADDAFNAGTLFEADVLAIAEQEPDLIILGGRSAALYDELKDIAPTIDMSSQGSFEETLERNVTFLGEVLGAQDEAATALEELEAGIEEAKAVTADAGTGLGIMVSGDGISALKPSLGDYSGRNLRGGLIYDVFGVQPVIEDIEGATHGEPVSFEFLLETDPDYLWVIDRNTATGGDSGSSEGAAAILDNDIVNQTTAAQNDQIVYLDPVAWYIVFGGIETTKIMTDDVMQIAE
ncbi:siderophore ABC transporter substrate-binding protein [Microbacterium sediminis]|uniref:siderophore ABC transporter substrate-binding protein n=1 Tax=Microbacterium sediminis TaxID=904291 RepID=UPI00138FF051|nr:ABC transporter substrate-binding protein [Microbacterium sediminis]